MDFYDSTNLDGIIDKVLWDCRATTTELPLAHLTREVNNAYSRVAYLIITADGRMKWDDTNHTNLPVSDTNLVASQTNYNVFAAAPSALQDWLTIERVEALEDNGTTWYQLLPFDQADLDGLSHTEWMETASSPRYYDFDGTNLWLKPPSNYNETLGLRIFFQRAPSYFAATDTTKRPGFATIFHEYLALYADYQIHRAGKAPHLDSEKLKRDIKEMEEAISRFYSTRAKFEKRKITPLKSIYK